MVLVFHMRFIGLFDRSSREEYQNCKKDSFWIYLSMDNFEHGPSVEGSEDYQEDLKTLYDKYKGDL